MLTRALCLRISWRISAVRKRMFQHKATLDFDSQLFLLHGAPGVQTVSSFESISDLHLIQKFLWVKCTGKFKITMLLMYPRSERVMWVTLEANILDTWSCRKVRTLPDTLDHCTAPSSKSRPPIEQARNPEVLFINVVNRTSSMLDALSSDLFKCNDFTQHRTY